MLLKNILFDNIKNENYTMQKLGNILEKLLKIALRTLVAAVFGKKAKEAGSSGRTDK